jgi:hypothetical protein
VLEGRPPKKLRHIRNELALKDVSHRIASIQYAGFQFRPLRAIPGNNLMKTLLLLFIVGSCAIEEPEPELSETESEIVSSTGQGTTWQGTTWQGTTWQGTTWQGTTWQGTSTASVTVGSATGYTASVEGTTISLWKYLPSMKWEQRLPNKICTWNLFRTSKTCTAFDLAVTPSPLAGANFVGTFRNGTTTFTGTVRIGASATHVGAVRSDPSKAMSALVGNTEAAACPVTACDNPGGCRSNCDLWLYDIRLVEVLDTSLQPTKICTQDAMAFAGSYAGNGQYDPAALGAIAFGCTNGTAAKCTRWGYRPFGSAHKTCSGSNCSSQHTTLFSLDRFHQACVRAAMADYCATGESYTKEGTLIDIYDYEHDHPAWKIIHPTPGAPTTEINAFVFESEFDPIGAVMLDHLRFTELGGPTTPYPPILPFNCLDSWVGLPPDAQYRGWMRDDSLPEEDPRIRVSSTPGCAHSEQTVGSWLHRDCSRCTEQISADPAYGYCTDPTDPTGWDLACTVRAAQCTGAQMASHSECTTGRSLQKYDSGCTLSLCLDPAYADCCALDKLGWSATCVAAANARCTGGQEHGHVGFCGN